MAVILDDLRKKYSVIYDLVKSEVEKVKDNQGHGFDHFLMVAQYGYLLCEDDRYREMAWVAGLTHDMHRIETMSKVAIEAALLGIFVDEDRMIIREAVLNHSKFNDPDDHPVTVALKDADRLANLGPANLLRAGQHMADIPAFIVGYYDAPHPDATFKNRVSVMDALYSNLEWEADERVRLRTPKAEEIAKKYFYFYRYFLTLHSIQCTETGLINPL